MLFVTAFHAKLASFRLFTHRVWALSKPYFASEEKWKARGLLTAIVVLNLALVYMAVLFNDWNKLFYDALQDKNADVFWTQLGRFTYLAFAFIVIAVYKFYLTQLLEMRWRALANSPTPISPKLSPNTTPTTRTSAFRKTSTSSPATPCRSAWGCSTR